MEWYRVPGHDVLLIELTAEEETILAGILNSADIVRDEFYAKVPVYRDLVDAVYTSEKFAAGRDRLHKEYGLGKMVKKGALTALDFKEDE